MRMAFALHPDDAARLSRAKTIARAPSTRPRYRAVHLTWHDSPERALRSDNLVLAESRGDRRLERLTPGRKPGLPGQPPPGIAEPDYPLPEGLAPVATFEGRLTLFVATTPAGPVTLELLRGTTGGVPLCRLTLDGGDAAVRDLALAIAGEFRLGLPRASLAAEAIAIAEDTEPPPRRLGAPEPFGDTTVATAFANTLGHFADILVYFAPRAAGGGPDTEPVHQMRVAVRRARSAIAVFKHGLACPDVAAADRDLKALGAVLGPTRDWDVFATETLPRVVAAFPDDRHLRRLEKAVQRAREAAHATLRDGLASPAFRQTTIGLGWLCASDSWHATLSPEEQVASAMTPTDFAAHVLQQRWKKMRSAGKSVATLDVPALHGLRLRTKRARYAMEIFIPADDAKPANRLIRRLSLLQQHLGTLNDGAVATGLLDRIGGPSGRHGYAVGLVLGFLAAAADAERPGIIQAWKKIRHSPRFWA
jgi:triphosphatase